MCTSAWYRWIFRKLCRSPKEKVQIDWGQNDLDYCWLSGSKTVFFVGWAISRCLSTTPHPIVVHGGSKLLEHLSSTPTHDMKRNELRSLVWNKRNFIFWTLQIAKWLFLRLLACQSISIYQVERAAWVSKNNFTVLEQKGDECSYWLKC